MGLCIGAAVLPVLTFQPVSSLPHCPPIFCRGVEVLIDGAHALGMLPLDLEALGADWFVGNCHKASLLCWCCIAVAEMLACAPQVQTRACTPGPPLPQWLCAPRGSAFLHVPQRHQAGVRPLIVSHGYGSGFVSEFIWDGCRDYAPLLAVSAALRAWRSLGPDAARAYQRRLLQQAVDVLVAAWGTGAPICALLP